MRRVLPFAIGLILLSVSQVWAQPYAGPDQRGFPFVRFSKVAAKAGFVNTPLVATSGGNATATLGVPVSGGLCSTAGCSDIEIVANASNAGTLVLTTQPATTLVVGQYVFIQVNDTGTAPSDVYFIAGAGVTLKSVQPGVSNGNLVGTTAADKTARQQSCGIPPATGFMLYNFIWDGTNLNLTGCSGNPPASIISPALIGGAQWASRAAAAGPSTDTVLASDTLIIDDTTSGNITESLPACVASGSASANPGKLYIFKKKDTTAGQILLTPNGTDQIDAAGAGIAVTISASQVEYPIICSPAGGVWLRGLPIPWGHSAGGTDVTAVGSNGQVLTSNGTNFVVLSRPVRPGFDFVGTVAINSKVAYTCAETWNFPTSLANGYPDANAQVTCGTSPGQTDTYTIKVTTNGVAVTAGTFTVSSATPCVGVFTGVTAPFSCAAGARLEIDGPGAFATSAPADVAITLGGHTP